jgi:hypothetical protein
MSTTSASGTTASSPARAVAGTLAFTAWCVTAAFGTYFCMYGFRKPFTAAGYEGATLWGNAMKPVLVASQVLGYMLSKFAGIRVIAAMPPRRRAAGILVLVGIAHLALLLFALLPPPLNVACLFLNGLPLGMVFGLVLGYLEGRRLTEALTAGLCASFILADGVTKSVGAALLKWGVSEAWMPFVAGLVFLPPLLVFVWMLTRIGPPSPEDVARRSERAPMSAVDRRRFLVRHAFGLLTIVAVFLLVTVLRSIRADFAPEIWRGLGQNVEPDVYTLSEMLVMLGVVAACALTVFVRDNRRAFHTAMLVALTGLMLTMLAAAGWQSGWLEGFGFMVLVGLGLYLPYVVVHTTVFERLIAMTRDRGNIGFLMYLADAFGYLGYVAVMLGRGFGGGGDVLAFFLTCVWVAALLSVLLLLAGWAWFFSQPRELPASPGPGNLTDAVPAHPGATTRSRRVK